MMLASSFTLVPLVGFMVAGNPNGFRLLALPAVLGLFVVPVLVFLLIPESPRWFLRRANPEAAVAVVNRIISRSGGRVAPLAVTELRENVAPALLSVGRTSSLKGGEFPERRLCAIRVFRAVIARRCPSAPCASSAAPRAGSMRR
jgi:hypothetical protein